MDIVFPDYDHSILGVVSSILKHYGAPARHPGLPLLDNLLKQPAKNTVVIVLDGLGSSALERLPPESFFRQHKLADLSSVFPCTTTASTTTLLTGLSPLEHGWLGWNAWFREFGRVVDLFLDRDSLSGTPVAPSPAQTLLPFKTILPLIMHAAGPNLQIRQIMPPFSSEGVNTIAQMTARIGDFCRLPGEQLILAYWYEPDTVMHNEGPASEAARQKIMEEDCLLSELSAGLPDTRMMITADHGQVEITREIYLDDIPELHECLILPPSLESRAASLFVKPTRLAEFPSIFNELLGDSFLLLPREEVFSRGMFGSGTPHRKVDDFIGDFLACATGSSMIRYRSLYNRPHSVFKGHHAGLCRDEMTVPLIFAAN